MNDVGGIPIPISSEGSDILEYRADISDPGSHWSNQHGNQYLYPISNAYNEIGEDHKLPRTISYMKFLMNISETLCLISS